MKIKKLTFLIAYLSFLSCSLHSATDVPLPDFDDDLTLDDIEKYEADHVVTRGGGPAIDPAILGILLKEFVKDTLWQNTKAPKGRDILYLLPHKITALEYGGFSAHLFFNMTDKLHVSAQSLFDVEKFDKDRLANFIQMLISDAVPDVSISAQEVMSLLPLLTGITIQERKGGSFIQGGFLRGPFSIQVQTSIQFSERNFWLNKASEQEIKAFSNKIYPGQELDQREFYKLAYGMGDTRLKFGMNTLNLTSLQTDMGIEAIFPTSRFAAKQRQIAVPENEADLNLLIEGSGISLLRGVRDYLLNPQFGNGGHFGLGCYFESKIGLFHNLAQLWTRLSYDFLFESDEVRLIMLKKTLTPDDLDQSVNPASPQEYAQRLVKFFKQYLLPPSFKVAVKPGGILNFVTSINVNADKWRFAVGYDFYAQQAEQITEIYNTNEDPSTLRIDDAEAGAINQHKIFAEAMRFKKFYKTDLGIGFGGDATIKSVGLGYDWTLYLKFAASF